MRSSNYETTRRIQMIDSLIIQIFLRNHRLDNMLHQIRANLFVGNILRMLRRDNNSVHTLRNGHTILQHILTGNLRLTIRTNPWADTILTNFRQLGTQASRKIMRQRHVVLRLIRSIPKHNTLITCTNILHLDCIHTLSDIRRLSLNGNNDITGLVVKSLGRIIVSNLFNGITNDLLVIHSRSRGDLSKDHNHTGLAAGLTGNTRHGISSYTGIEDGIGYLIAKLIGMTLIYRLGSEKE
mmetsp:Transcript_8338/g.10720  ORF Transcript_8338/g.10720 Transcript_8338/m.10720 type:complete len:239 (-) Transcript_8338:123-839(-)